MYDCPTVGGPEISTFIEVITLPSYKSWACKEVYPKNRMTKKEKVSSVVTNLTDGLAACFRNE